MATCFEIEVIICVSDRYKGCEPQQDGCCILKTAIFSRRRPNVNDKVSKLYFDVKRWNKVEDIVQDVSGVIEDAKICMEDIRSGGGLICGHWD